MREGGGGIGCLRVLVRLEKGGNDRDVWVDWGLVVK